MLWQLACSDCYLLFIFFTLCQVNETEPNVKVTLLT